MARLIVTEGPDRGSEFDLGAGTEVAGFTAGRDPGVEIPLGDGAVSRRHFVVEARGGRWLLKDLGSRNRTLLNGTPVREALLRHEDAIRAGDTEMHFDDPGRPIASSSVLTTIIRELPAGHGNDSVLLRLREMEERIPGAPGESAAPKALRRILAAFGDASASRPRGDILSKLLSEIAEAVGAARAAILVAEDGKWTVKAGHPEDEASSGVPLQVSTTVLERVTREGKAVLCADLLEDEALRGKRSIVEGGIASAMAAPVPLPARGIAAALYCHRRRGAEPFREEDLEVLAAAAGPAGSVLESVLGEEELRRENQNLFRAIAETKKIVGKSKPILEVLERIRKAAPAPMTVLIQGETGTGKELVAAAIHYSSPRRGKPFVAINCAALPENLVESELFGHERGAFTGAAARRKGRFELASGGTVFLDEVGELSLACQAKLLRLLEEREFERVGGSERVRVDVRILAATNQDLLRAVATGRFREDLYYRLNVLAVRVPPLRERREDIALLATHFLRETGAAGRGFTPAALARLEGYSWPGNVRQLRNVVESAAVLGGGGEIGPDEFTLPDTSSPSAVSAAPRVPESSQVEAAWKPISLEEMERIHIRRILEHTRGNKKKAAEILGIERCTLYAKLKTYDLTPDADD